MGKSQRAKGAAGELMLLKRIDELTGIKLKRNASIQAGEKGNSDLIDLYGVSVFADWSIEVKNTAVISVNPWWQQTLEQAAKYGKKPLLCYHIPRTKRWVAVVRALHVLIGYSGVEEDYVSMELEVFLSYLHIMKNDTEGKK